MKPISEVTCCVVDNGLFLPVARRLAQDVKKVYYWTISDPTYPQFADFVPGFGFPELEIPTHLLDIEKELDLVVFTHIGFRPYQEHFKAMGVPTWGGGGSEILEVNKRRFLEELRECGLEVPEHVEIEGGKALLEYARKVENVWIKVSKWRKTWETFHWLDWQRSHVELELRLMHFGAFVKHIVFYVFNHIETDIEDGADADFVDGRWPKVVNHGLEKKDLAYLITFCDFKDLPEPVLEVHTKFGPVLEKYGHRGPFSSEIRVKDKVPIFTDPTPRYGSPPSQIQTALVKNFSERIWLGANGECVDPEPAWEFGIQVLVNADAPPRPGYITVPISEELDPWLKVSVCGFEDGAAQFPPWDEDHAGEIGWLLGVGDTIEDAMDNLREHQALLPDGLECNFSALADLLKEARDATDQGMPFTEDDIPDPSSILDD